MHTSRVGKIQGFSGGEMRKNRIYCAPLPLAPRRVEGYSAQHLTGKPLGLSECSAAR